MCPRVSVTSNHSILRMLFADSARAFSIAPSMLFSDEPTISTFLYTWLSDITKLLVLGGFQPKPIRQAAVRQIAEVRILRGRLQVARLSFFYRFADRRSWKPEIMILKQLA